MRAILFASAMTLLAGPALAQSCVSGGQFVPCGAGGGMQPGMGMQGGMGMQPGMGGSVQPGVAAQPGMQQAASPDEQRPMRRAKRKKRS